MHDVRLNIPLSWSRRHCFFLLAVHALLLVAIVALPLSFGLRLLFLASLLVHGVWSLFGLLRLAQISHLMLESERVVFVSNGERQVVEAFMPVLVTGWIMILKLTHNGGAVYLALWNDSADVDQLRQLRVWLLCRGV